MPTTTAHSRATTRVTDIPRRTSSPFLSAAAVVAAVCVPSLATARFLWVATRGRLRADDRGDAVQWVILVAVGAAIAITIGGIIYTKLTSKANSIDVNTTTGP